MGGPLAYRNAFHSAAPAAPRAIAGVYYWPTLEAAGAALRRECPGGRVVVIDGAADGADGGDRSEPRKEVATRALEIHAR